MTTTRPRSESTAPSPAPAEGGRRVPVLVTDRTRDPVAADTLLEVRDLEASFRTTRGDVRALDGVSFRIRRGETFGLVGESGCGKSVTALTVLRLASAHAVSGEVRFNGVNLLTLPEKAMRRLRGNDASMIFQEPMTALNPVFTVGDQIAEVLKLHGRVPGPEGAGKRPWPLSRLARRRHLRAAVAAKLKEVGIPNAERVANQYPHELSGGMRQRVMIAMMLACEPDLLIADEPTTALDATIQAQILDLVKRLQERRGMAMWLITHDLGVVAATCDTVGVMYAGRVVEYATVDAVFREPRHPYTIGLLAAVPRPRGGADATLPVIPGRVPDLADPPTGCRFHPRCPLATDACRESAPPLEDVGDGHLVACHHKDATRGGRVPEAGAATTPQPLDGGDAA